MKFLILLLALIPTFSSISIAQSRDRRTQEQYWNTTGLNFSTFSSILQIQSRNCYGNVLHFRACFAALNAIISLNDNNSRIFPNETLSRRELFEIEEEVRSFGSASLVRLKSVSARNLPLQEEARINQEYIRTLQEVYTRSFFQTFQNQIDFTGLFDYAKGLAEQNPEQSAMNYASALNAAFQVTDPHAHIEVGEALHAQFSQADEELFGIGIVLISSAGRKIIYSTEEGGPADQAGLRVNDQLLAINGSSVQEMIFEQISAAIRGAEGSHVVLRIQRGEEQLEIPVRRARMSIQNVTSRLIDVFERKIVYIRIRSFADNNMCDKVMGVVQSYSRRQVHGYILDLRGNVGGLLNEAVCLGSLFLGQRTILRVRDLQSTAMEEIFGDVPIVINLPVSVLIDSRSASASEIVAGAIQDYQRGWIVGEPSFGKGTVQSESSFMPHLLRGVVLFSTTQQFYQPSGRSNQFLGITPDFNIQMRPGMTDEERFTLRESDLYPSTIVETNSPQWRQQRPQQVENLQRCIQDRNRVASRYNLEMAAGSRLADFQLLNAVEIMSCDAARRAELQLPSHRRNLRRRN